MSKAQVISLINMKGGVGKTTCAVNLATYLAKDHGQRVLLVDFDPQTNASLSVMSEKAWQDWQEDHGTMADVLEVQWKKKHGRVERGARNERPKANDRRAPSPSSNRTCGFPASGFRRTILGSLHEAFTGR
jgi:cellulose biosynthesis protein BcsQ